MMFCLDDGSELLYGPASSEARIGADEPQTAILHDTSSHSEAATRAHIDKTEVEPRESLDEVSEK